MFEDEEWDEQAFVNSERSRVTMSCVLRYCEKNKPEILVVENVLEVTKWGPGSSGSSFKWWMTELDKLGYEIRPCFFNSQFFAPCPQSRDRIYIVAWRKGNTAPDLDYRPTAYCTSDICCGRIVPSVQTWKKRTKAWMLPAWGKYGAQYTYNCPECRARVHPATWMALTAIDFSNLGPTLGERVESGKPPAPNTWERIRRAVEKYKNAPPVILSDGPISAQQVQVAHAAVIDKSNAGSPAHKDGNRSRSIAEQLPSLTRSGHLALAVGTVPMSSEHGAASAASEAMSTILAGGKSQGVACLPLTIKNNGAMEEAGYRGHHGAESLGALTTYPTQSVVAIIVPNRTNNVGHHAGISMPPVMTSATEGVVIAAAGNTSERPGQTRARSIDEALFTQSTTPEFAVATVQLRGDHTQDNHGSDSLDTVSAGGMHHAVVTALFSKINGGPGDTSWHGIDEALNTVTGRDTHGLVVVPWIDHWISDPVMVTEQLATITARLRHTLASIEPSSDPITDEMLMNIRFRMLEPDPELRRAMAFGEEYVLLGNKGQMTAGLGNAVTPPVASWITKQCLATLS
jgi:site-specific DNA-cytosine methylase